MGGCSPMVVRSSSLEAVSPEDAALESKAYASVEQGDLLIGIDMLKEILRKDRTNAKAMYVLGYVYGQLGEIENEINYYEGALKAGYIQEQAFHNLGKAYLGNDQTSLAIQSFKKGLALNPGNADNHFGLGLAYQNIFEYDKAENEFLKAIHLASDVPEFREYLGRFYEDVGELEKAEEQYRQIIQMAPTYEGANEYLEHIEKKRKLRYGR
jgi:Tfp pilus assembly protein PilF